MDVHPGAVITYQRLGHKRRGFAVGVRYVVYAVLKDLHLVRLLNQRVEANPDFTLTSGAHLMVMNLDREPHLLHGRTHGCSDVMERVDGWNGEVAAFYPGTVASVAIVIVTRGRPGRFF